MEIIYPPLVEQSFSYYSILDAEIDKSDLYQWMVNNNIITETGLPTQNALDEGFIKDFYEEENLTFEQFLSIYPVFATYDADIFQRIDGFWEVPIEVKEALLQELSSGQLAYDIEIQISEYLADR